MRNSVTEIFIDYWYQHFIFLKHSDWLEKQQYGQIISAMSAKSDADILFFLTPIPSSKLHQIEEGLYVYIYLLLIIIILAQVIAVGNYQHSSMFYLYDEHSFGLNIFYCSVQKD